MRRILNSVFVTALAVCLVSCGSNTQKETEGEATEATQKSDLEAKVSKDALKMAEKKCSCVALLDEGKTAEHKSCMDEMMRMGKKIASKYEPKDKDGELKKLFMTTMSAEVKKCEGN